MSCAVCYGTSYGFSQQGVDQVPEDDEDAKVTARYEKYKETYTNCTVIDGNLEIVFLIAPGNRIFDLHFLRDIREVTSRPASSINRFISIIEKFTRSHPEMVGDMSRVPLN